MRTRVLAIAFLLGVARSGIAGLFDDVSHPPSLASSPGLAPAAPAGLSPAVQEEIRRLLRAAEAMRDKAEAMHRRAEDLRAGDERPASGERPDEQADELDDRADDFDEKAGRFEDQADELAHLQQHQTPTRR
jgi:hypothetical protein